MGGFLRLLGVVGCLFVLVGVADAGQVVLQQGVSPSPSYSGCSAVTLWSKGRPEAVSDEYLYLRAEANRLLLRFELPEELRGRRIARAKLMLFLPKAGPQRAMLEIFCHEVLKPWDARATWRRATTTESWNSPGGDYDVKTDYANGRPAGAVDSFELFRSVLPGGQNPFPWLSVGVPEGGMWMEFNVTPLVEKWLKRPETNFGVILVPKNPPARKSNWRIDIPSPLYKADPALRPKLVIDLADESTPAFRVGVTHGMIKICSRSWRYTYRGKYEPRYRLYMAGNEFEPFQVVVEPILQDLRNVKFTWTDLKGPGGSVIPRQQISAYIEDVYRMRQNWKTRDLFFDGKLYEVPDPLLPIDLRPIHIRRHQPTAFWFCIRTKSGTKPGVYKGKIVVSADGVKPQQIALEVKVWNYDIPEKWNFHTMGQFIYENVARFYGDRFNEQVLMNYYDFLLDHRFSPTEQYRNILSPRTARKYCLDRGMNTIYLSGNFKGTPENVQQIRERMVLLKKEIPDVLDRAVVLVYIGDETSDYAEMRRRANLVHAYCPGAMVMVGGSKVRKELLGYVDIYDPQIDGRSKVYSLQINEVDQIRKAQRRGEEYYWYVAAGPHFPHPNVQLEYPAATSRVLFWMTWKFGPTGYEYYCYNIWHHNIPKPGQPRYPQVPWQADGWDRGWPTNCDGLLFYPGPDGKPVSSIRFENHRDGIEDWESLYVFRDYAEALRQRGGGRYASLLKQAAALLQVPAEVCSDFTHWTRRGEVVLEYRRQVGETIDRISRIVSRAEYIRVRDARIAEQLRRRKQMLAERHRRALKELGLTEEQVALPQ